MAKDKYTFDPSLGLGLMNDSSMLKLLEMPKAFTTTTGATSLEAMLGNTSSPSTALDIGTSYTDNWLTNGGGLDIANTIGGETTEGLGLTDWLGKQDLGQLTGLANLGLGAYNTFFGPQSELFEQQIATLKDQRAANQESLANTRKFNENWAKASATVDGLGKVS